LRALLDALSILGYGPDFSYTNVYIFSSFSPIFRWTLERFSYRHAFSKRALRPYEDYTEVRAQFDELKVLRSRGIVREHLDTITGFLKVNEGCV